MSSHRSTLYRSLAVFVAALSALPWLGGTATSAQEDSVATLRLVSQPTFHLLGDDFSLKVRVENTSSLTTLNDYRLVVGVFFRVQTRSDLHDRFDLSGFEAPSSFPVEIPGAIPPGGTRVIEIDSPLSDSPVMEAATENGVYPLRISLVDPLGSTVAAETSQILYYPVAPDPPDLAMNAVLMVPVSTLPARSPNGVFMPGADGRFPLEDAIAAGGWLRGLADNISSELNGSAGNASRAGRAAASRGLRIGLAPSARLLEELADMADGYQRATGDEIERVPEDSETALAAAGLLQDLTTLVDSTEVQPIPAPYAFPDLPSLAPYPGATALQMAEANSIYQTVLDRRFPQDWVLAPGNRLDAASLEELRLAGTGVHTFFSEDSLLPVTEPDLSGCPTPELSRTCPVAVPLGTEDVTGFTTDADLQARVQEMTRPGATFSDLQRFFAETSMIREETPSRGDRVISVSLPPDWEPSRRRSRLLFRGLSRAPWLEMMIPSEALSATTDISPREVEAAAADHPAAPEPSFFDSVFRSSETVESFATIEPPADLLLRLRRNILTSLSREWWRSDQVDGALDFALDPASEVRGELDKIGLIGASETTLTSREGKIQLVAFNETGYEVKVALELSGALEFDEADREIVIPEEQQIITLDVTARTSGIFPLEVFLQTPDGGLQIEQPKTITIRSTEFNRIALGITIGSLAFLVLFYVVRALRKRRNHTGTEASAA